MEGVRHEIAINRHSPSGKGVTVAVLDTGVDEEHPDLTTCVDLASSRCFCTMVADLVDRHGHGTHVAGIIAGSGAASGGRFRGIAPETRVLMYKIAGGRSATESAAAAAVVAAAEAGVDIINYSVSYSPRERVGDAPWVWPTELTLIEDAFQAAADRGVLCIVAAGNDGPSSGSINRPGGLKEVLTVGATAREGGLLNCSSRGPFRSLNSLRRKGERRFEPMLDGGHLEWHKPDLLAPGEKVFAPRSRYGISFTEHALLDPTDPKCPYAWITGTSQATAVVSGLAACLLQVIRDYKIRLGPNPGACMKSLLCHSARRLQALDADDQGWGVLRWPVVLQTLRDYVNDKQFREVIRNGAQLRLMP